MKKYLTGLVCVACLFMAAASVGAQDYRGRVQGKVLDSSQAVLPGVTVTLSNDATGVVVTRATDPAGGFVFDFIEPGTYTVTVQDTNRTDAAEFVVLSGTFKGDADLSLAFTGTPLGRA